MSHNHDNHTHSHNGSTKNISVAFFLNAFFVIIEIVGGILTNSIAILSDALHDLGDCISLAIAYILQKKAAQVRDDKYTYGYKRFSLLGAVFLSGVLTITSIYVIIEAFKRILSPENVRAEGMLWLAIFGIIINGVAAFRLSKGSSLNERSVYLHIMEDVLGWVAILIASIVMMFINIPVLDPILSIGISIWVLSNVVKNLKETFKIFLQRIPDNLDVNSLKKMILSINGVISLHDLHIWSMDGESHIMTIHIVVSDITNTHTIKEQILTIAKNKDIVHTTIEFEDNLDQPCDNSCD